MIEIIVSVITAFFFVGLFFYLSRKIKNHAHILLISMSLLAILLIFNLLLNAPIINFIVTFTIFVILLLFILEIIKSSNSLFNGESIFQEEETKG
ncbi:MAG: hypothetical protein ACTSUC_00660 [Promethearchaeota archaeon]